MTRQPRPLRRLLAFFNPLDGACDFIDYPACIRIQAGLHAFLIGISQLVACEVFAALLFEILYGPQVDSEQLRTQVLANPRIAV